MIDPVSLGDHRLRGTVIGALICLLAALPATAGQDIVGKPRVISGDTMEVAGIRLHLFGIDAPELGQTCVWPNKTIDCGNLSRTALLDLVAVATVRCRRQATDSGEPWTAACTAEGFDIARNMVHTGWAVTLPDDPAGFKAVENRAKSAKRGVWRGRFTAPWIWRADR